VDSLILDGENYDNSTTPLYFNYIDTLNLINYVSILNLLIITSLLFEHGVAASLYTEIIVRKKKIYKDLIDGLLYGYFFTVLILLRLFLVKYYTNINAVFTVDEILFNIVTSLVTRNLLSIIDFKIK
jgi:hypothetical protein